jgi:hypothetical protein
MNMIFLLLMIPVWASTFALTITDLTRLPWLDFKPFNCFVCLSWWFGLIGGISTMLMIELPWHIESLMAIGTGGMSVIYTYFIRKNIWKQ